MKRKNKTRKTRQRKRQVRKKTPPRRPKHQATPGLQQLTRSVAAILVWSQKAEGLGGAIRSAYRSVESETNDINAGAFVKVLQKDRPILEELYVWAHESSRLTNHPASKDVLPVVEEGVALVESVFSRLKECFGVDIIYEPDTTIATPARNSKRYKFSERFNPDRPTSRILFPGLKQGSKVISPCEVEQIVTVEEGGFKREI